MSAALEHVPPLQPAHLPARVLGVDVTWRQDEDGCWRSIGHAWWGIVLFIEQSPDGPWTAHVKQAFTWWHGARGAGDTLEEAVADLRRRLVLIRGAIAALDLEEMAGG
jgi:hypothetical protein